MKLGRLEEMIARLGSKENGRELGEVAGTVPACDSGTAEEAQGIRLESVARDTVPNGGLESRTSEEISPAKADKFMGGPFWRSLSSEVGGLLQLLDQTTEEDTDLDDVPEPSASIVHVPNPRFPFESGPQAVALRSLHPSTSHIALLLKIYLSNVDPIFKLLHRPTLRLSVLEAAADLHNMPGGQSMEALMFAMYFAAVNTLTEEDCVAQFAEQKNALSVKFRYGTEMALANANFLSSDSMSTLQALVLFVVSLRSRDEGRVAWTLTALAVRIAHSLGLHRDGSGSSFSPFEAEMRQRLWWQICVLDTRACEDRNSDPSIFQHTYNTQLPSNVNDGDIGPGYRHRTIPRIGGTDMTFCLISHEASKTYTRFTYVPPSPDASENSVVVHSLQEKEALISEFSQRLETQYLRFCDPAVPVFWVASTVARLIISRMWLGLHFPLQPSPRCRVRSDAVRETAFRTAVTVLEYAHMLETNNEAKQWTWFFGSYVQWHALAITLAILCNQTSGSAVARAWVSVDTVFERWSERVADTKRGMLWRPIKKLYNRARQARQYDEAAAVSQALIAMQAQRVPRDDGSARTPTVLPKTSESFHGSLSRSWEAPPELQQQQEFARVLDPNLGTSSATDLDNWAYWNQFVLDTQELASNA